jgi:hypothetical protein
MPFIISVPNADGWSRQYLATKSGARQYTTLPGQEAQFDTREEAEIRLADIPKKEWARVEEYPLPAWAGWVVVNKDGNRLDLIGRAPRWTTRGTKWYQKWEAEKAAYKHGGTVEYTPEPEPWYGADTLREALGDWE